MSKDKNCPSGSTYDDELYQTYLSLGMDSIMDFLTYLDYYESETYAPRRYVRDQRPKGDDDE
jgi:hypothetical protein